MSEFVVAVGLVLVIEGLVYIAAPGAAKRMMALALDSSDQLLRTGGAIALGVGVVIVWLAKGL